MKFITDTIITEDNITVRRLNMGAYRLSCMVQDMLVCCTFMEYSLEEALNLFRKGYM